MTQNISQNVNQYGTVTRIGTTPDGRGLYQIDDPKQKQSIRMSVAAQDCDTFERSYTKILESAPKLQEYAEKTPPEKIARNQKFAKWLVAGLGIVGGLIPLIKCKGNGFWGTLKQLGVTLLGTGAGLGVGIFAASKLITPPGAKDFAKATQDIAKLDVRSAQ